MTIHSRFTVRKLFLAPERLLITTEKGENGIKTVCNF